MTKKANNGDMKNIYVVRHAKSDWSDFRLSDHDRPLNDRGNNDAPLMAKELIKRIHSVDYFLCSSAVRAKETFHYFKDICPKNDGLITGNLYHSSPQTIMGLIRELPEYANGVIIFAHNPGLTDLYNYFSKNYLDNLPTCGVFELRSTAKNWTVIARPNTGTGFLFYPKMIK